MRGALLEDMKTGLILVGILVILGVIGGFAWVTWSRAERKTQQMQAAIQDCPNDRNRLQCARRVEEKHDDCYQSAKRPDAPKHRRFDLRAYRRCLGVPMPFEGMTPDQILKKGLNME